MKKVLLGIGCAACVVVGALLIWNFVVPFIGTVITGFFGIL